MLQRILPKPDPREESNLAKHHEPWGRTVSVLLRDESTILSRSAWERVYQYEKQDRRRDTGESRARKRRGS